MSVPCVCYGLAFERVAAGSRARGHTTNARAGSRARGARDATHRRRRVYIDARDARNRRSNATDARSDGINTRGRRGDGAPRSWRRRRRRRRRARTRATKRGDRSKRSVNASFWMIWCAATLERANGDGMGDIKNADARGRLARGARGGRAKRATRTRARRLTTTRSTVIGFAIDIDAEEGSGARARGSRGRGWVTTRGANLVGAANRRDFGGARGAFDSERRGRAIERLTTRTTTLDRESQTTRSSRSAR